MKTVQLTVLFVCGLLSYYSVKGFPNREYNSVESVCDLIPKSFPNVKKNRPGDMYRIAGNFHMVQISYISYVPTVCENKNY